jgi:hypothetical protein
VLKLRWGCGETYEQSSDVCEEIAIGSLTYTLIVVVLGCVFVNLQCVQSFHGETSPSPTDGSQTEIEGTGSTETTTSTNQRATA